MQSSMRIASVIALIWTALGAADYILTRLAVPQYLSFFDTDMVAFFTQVPLWVDIA